MTLFEQFRQAEETISKEGSEFTLFGLFEREDVPGKYDVVVSAPWLTGGRMSLMLIAELVRKAIGNDYWWPSIARFVVLPTDEPFVSVVLSKLSNGSREQEVSVEHDIKIVNDLAYEGEIIRNAVIITAQRHRSANRIHQPVAA